MSVTGWRGQGRLRWYWSQRFGAVVLRVAGRQVQLSASPSSVAVTWGARA